MWSEGIAAGDLRPFLGAGYQAYWVQGFSEAERLWKEFYIENRSGFHFHNTYIEIYVELGFLGLFTYVMVLLSTLVRLSVRVATRRDSEAAVLVGLSVLLLVRSFFEVDSLYPYTVGSFLVDVPVRIRAPAPGQALRHPLCEIVRCADPCPRARLDRNISARRKQTPSECVHCKGWGRPNPQRSHAGPGEFLK